MTRVSVCMCVYNGAAYLDSALASIQRQTLRDWECIVVDDGSSDDTPAILSRYAAEDSRFQVYRNERNLGIPRSRNRALELAQGTYVACMDADDICCPDRLERQVAFMDANPRLALSSCRYFPFRDGCILPVSGLWRTDLEAVQALLLFFNPILNPGVIGRRPALQAFGYDPAYSCTEDLDLWMRMLAQGQRLAIQPEYLMLYRLHGKQVTSNTLQGQREQYRRIIRRFYGQMLFPLSQEDVDFLAEGVFFRTEPDIRRLTSLLGRIHAANGKTRRFDSDALRYAMWELLLEYRRAGVSSAALAPAMLKLGPVFLAKELYRRRQAGKEDQQRQSEALKRFSGILGEEKS